MSKIKVGQTIWYRPLSWDLRVDTSLKKDKVTKVGQEYFELEKLIPRFRIDSMETDNPLLMYPYKAYLSEQEYLDEREYAGIELQIESSLGKWPSLPPANIPTLDQLRRIKAILDEKP